MGMVQLKVFELRIFELRMVELRSFGIQRRRYLCK
jgi:hypothetical protein